MNYLLDAAILVVLALFFFVGWKKGFVTVAVDFLGTIVSAFLAFWLGGVVSGWIYTTFLRQNFADKVLAVLGDAIPSLEQLQKVLDSFPAFVARALETRGITASSLTDITNFSGEEFAYKVADAVSPVFISLVKFFAVIVIFILCLLAVKLLAKTLGLAFKLPLLKQLNEMGGAVLNIARGLVFVWLACAALQLLVPALKESSQAFWNAAIAQSTLFDLIYAHNPLYTLFT